MTKRRQPMKRYWVEYEDFKSAFDPYVTPGTGFTTVLAHNKEHAKSMVEEPGRRVTSVTRDE